MTPTEKAKQIADKWYSATNESVAHDCCYLSALDMYDWTREQVINRAYDVVWDLLKGYHIEDCDGKIYNKPKFFENLLKSMEKS